MPRLDGTGPAGQGPMTGRGMGPCGAGYGYGRGRGRGMGYGRCFGWGFQTSYRQPTITEEKDMVQDDVEALREELKAAEARLAELENQK